MNTNLIIDNSEGLASIGVNLTIQNGLIILTFATALGLILRQVFLKYANSFSSRNGFGNTLVLVTISVAALIAVVKSSLALSLGLVGALSVIRFRTAVKEPYNLAFILLAVCIGISIGASQYIFAIITFIYGIGVILLIYKDGTESKTNRSGAVMLDTISITVPSDCDLETVYSCLDKYAKSYTVKSLNTNSNESTNLILNLELSSHRSLTSLIEALKQTIPSISLSFYNAISI